MNLLDILSRDAILAELHGTETHTLFAELCAPLGRSEGIDATELAGALAEREAQGSTAMGSGVAVPHGVHPRLVRVVACFGRARAGIELAAPDGLPVQLFVALLRPPEAAGAHLEALACVSRLLGDPAVRSALLAADSVAQIHDILAAAATR